MEAALNNRVIYKNRWRKWMLLLICISLTLIVSKGILCFYGYKTLRYLVRPNEQTMYGYHPVLGWQSKEGSYHIPQYDSYDREIDYTFLANGLRKTHPTQVNTLDNRHKLIFIGC